MKKGRTAGVKLAVRSLFLGLALAAPAAALTPEQDLRRIELRREAARLKAWEDPGWRKLLYYENDLRGRPRSPSVNPQFFLSRWGAINPRLELEAAVDGLYYEGPADDAPECRFPERYRRLRAGLRLSYGEFPARSCPAFEEWRASLDPESVSLLFAAGYLNNPSTLYGHTFLRLHKRGGAGADLLDYTINYAATTGEDKGLFFALKGLAGAYPGQFSTMPYYLKIQEYHNAENRDIWEFPLSLDQDEIDRLLRHSWELGKAAFPYYFFTRNCSWQVLPLLDIAKPELKLSGKFNFWVIPSDTAKAVIEASPAAEPGWRPALWKTVAWKRSQLSGEEQRLVLDLSGPGQAAALPRLRLAMPQRQAALLETASDYLTWQVYARKLRRAEMDRLLDPLLAERAALGPQTTFTGAPARPASVAAAHDSLRLGAGVAALEGGPAYELSARFALQDLLDDPAGYLDDAALQMGALRLRYEPRYNRAYFKEARLAHVLSLNAWDPWVRRPSWEVAAGLEQAPETGRGSGSAAVWAMSAGAGLAAEAPGVMRQVWYALAYADSAFGPALRSNWRAGAGLKAGVAADRGPLRLHAEARYAAYALGDTRPLWSGEAAASWRLSRGQALRLRHEWRTGAVETGVYFHQYLKAP